ncbi:MAG: hypothetical protein ACRD8O_00320 [Bryobacteraceae bacterium]
MTWLTGWRRSSEDRQIRSFLLGTIDETRKAAVEERMFEDEDYQARLEDARNDLFDAYVRRRLGVEDRRRFEERLLGSRTQELRLQVASALALKESRRAAGDRAPVSLPPRRLVFALAGAAAVGCGLAGWMALENGKLRGQLRTAQKAPAASIRPLEPVVVAPLVARLTLSPHLARSSEVIQTAPVPDTASLVRVELVTDETRASYAAVLEAAGRGRVWSQVSLNRTSDGVVVLWLPGEVLRPGEYEFLLQGGPAGKELLGSYLFQIVRP